VADTGLNGYWKGLFVSQNLQAVVHLYFEQNGDALSGTFESSDLPSASSKGNVTGSIDANNKLTLSIDAPGRAQFVGQSTGQGTASEMISGVVQVPAGQQPMGTLTLFRQPDKIIVERY
jgi:hypothetical protein